MQGSDPCLLVPIGMRGKVWSHSEDALGRLGVGVYCEGIRPDAISLPVRTMLARMSRQPSEHCLHHLQSILVSVVNNGGMGDSNGIP